MLSFIQPLEQMAEFEEIEKTIEKKQGIVPVTGCLESQKAHLIHGLSQKAPMRLVIAGDERLAKETYEDLRFYDKNTGKGSSVFPGRHSGKSVDTSENVRGKGTSGTGKPYRSDQHRRLYGLSDAP